MTTPYSLTLLLLITLLLSYQQGSKNHKGVLILEETFQLWADALSEIHQPISLILEIQCSLQEA